MIEAVLNTDTGRKILLNSETTDVDDLLVLFSNQEINDILYTESRYGSLDALVLYARHHAIRKGTETQQEASIKFVVRIFLSAFIEYQKRNRYPEVKNKILRLA